MRKKAIVLGVTVLFLLIAAGAFWHSRSRSVMADVRSVVETGLSQSLGGSILLGSMELTAWNELTIHQVTLYDKQGNLAASGDQIHIAYSLWGIFQGKAAVSLIQKVIIEQPELFLKQRPDGSWNIEDIIQQQEGEARFTGEVVLKNGRLSVDSLRGFRQLEGINGSLDFAANPAIDLQLAAAYQGTDISVAGALSDSNNLSLTLKAERLSLVDLQEFCQAELPLRLVEGDAKKINLTIRRQDGDFHFAGEAGLDHAGFDVDAVPVRAAQGLMTFTDNRVYLFQTAEIYDQPVNVRGWIAVDTGEPVFKLAVSSSGFDPGAIDPALPLQGPVSFNADVSGTIADPLVTGEFQLKQGTMAGYGATDVSVRLKFADQNLTLQEFHGNVWGGRVEGAGTVNLTQRSYRLTARGQHLDSQYASQWVPGLSAYGDIQIAAAGSLDGIDGMIVYGTAALQAGTYSGIPFASIDTGFYRSGEQIGIDYANIVLEGGLLTAGGRIDNGSLNLNIRGRSLPLSLAARQIDGLPLDGTADFSGTLTGTVDSPSLAAAFTAVNGQAFYQPFAQARGNVQIRPDQVILDNIELVSGPASHRIQGKVGLTGRRDIDLTVISHQARGEDLIRLLSPGERFTGNIDNEMVLSGSLDNFDATGKITLTDGSFRGYLLAKAGGTYSRQNGVLRLNDFVIQSLNSQIQLSGAIYPGNELELDVAAHHIDLSRLYQEGSYPLTGQADFAGKLTGTPAMPRFDGRFSADKLTIKNQELRQLTGSVAVDGNAVFLPAVRFFQGPGRYSFSGGADLAVGTIFGQMDVEQAEVAPLLAVCNVPLQGGINGRLNGHVVLNGTFTQPNLWITGSMTSGSIKKYPLENVDVDVALENNIVTINHFAARQGKGTLFVLGTAAINGPLNLEVGGSNIDAGILTAWFDSDAGLKGNLNFSSQISGTSVNPHAAVSLGIKGGTLANATFDDLYGLFIINKHRIHVNQLMLAKGSNKITAYGEIPLGALTAEGRQQATEADQMNLTLDLNEGNLSMLPLFNGQLSWAAGKTQGKITVGGTLAEPVLTGSVSVDEGAFKLKLLSDPIQKVGLAIQFEGDKINVKSFDGSMGSGSYRLTGSARLDGLSLADYNMLLVLDKLGVNSKYFKGSLNGTLTLAGSGHSPKLSGKLLFDHDMINIPYVAAVEPTDMNLGLDVELVAGNKVRFYNPYMYDIMAEGRVRFTGSIREPVASGRITALRGTVNYLSTQFQIKEARAEFTQYGSFEPVIHLQADTKLQEMAVNLKIDGPVTAMEFQLTSDPAMSQQEILSLLTLRSRYFSKQNNSNTSPDTGFGRDEMMSLLDAGLQLRFISEVEDIFRNATGFDNVRFVRSTDTTQKAAMDSRQLYNLEVGKYITDRLMLSYIVGVDHSEHGSAFRYDLSSRVSLTGSLDNQNHSRFGLETRVRF
ncbi:MAG: translocation/assembly module TamB domain-containing protein [Veillonellales bacterium]